MTCSATASWLEFWIEADTFMRHMNRALVGTMLEVARGRRSVGDFAALLEGAPRPAAGPTAPAHGLYFAGAGTGGSGCWGKGPRGLASGGLAGPWVGPAVEGAPANGLLGKGASKGQAGTGAAVSALGSTETGFAGLCCCQRACSER